MFAFYETLLVVTWYFLAMFFDGRHAGAARHSAHVQLTFFVVAFRVELDLFFNDTVRLLQGFCKQLQMKARFASSTLNFEAVCVDYFAEARKQLEICLSFWYFGLLLTNTQVKLSRFILACLQLQFFEIGNKTIPRGQFGLIYWNRTYVREYASFIS